MGRKVLIVDDSALLHRLYDLVLSCYTRIQLEPLFAADGEEGLRRLAEHPDVELVFLDINMPAMSGLEFLRRVREQPALAGLRIVMQSTEDRRADIERALEAGASAYLTKPFTAPQLHAVLDRMLS